MNMIEKIYDNQFFIQGIQIMPKQKSTVYAVIAKPTRVCNANCSYCSSPPLEEMGDDWEPEWKIEDFKHYFNKVYPHMVEGAFWIWHGGEPMLMGPKFYRECFEYASNIMKKNNKWIHFSIQSNMLGYNEKWREIFGDVFGGSLSTSFDPDEKERKIKSSSENYSRIFFQSLNNILEDGFRPMVISVFSEETAHLMHKMYDLSLSYEEKAFPIRLNYCHPSGRFENEGEVISPTTYGKYLIEIYNRWIHDDPNFTVTPLDIMFKKTIGLDGEGHCPWTKKCGGRFIEIEPNGDIYNCSEFADIGKKYCFGNLKEQELDILLQSTQAIKIKRRAVQLPVSCMNCEHFDDCEGGCARDALLFQNGMYGKFHYCISWKMVFSRIKESILLGEADNLIKRYGQDPRKIKNEIKNPIERHFSGKIQESFYEKGLLHSMGFAHNIFNEKNLYNEQGEFLLKKEKDLLYKEEKSKLLSIPIQIQYNIEK